MALKTDLRSPDDKKFKGHTEDKTIKVADAKSVIKKIMTKLNPSFILTNIIRDKISKEINKKLKTK